MLAQILLPLLLAATSALAVSLPRGKTCSVPTTALNLQPPFPPLSTPPRYVALGVGVQNYTCSASGNYTSVGAVADLFDISCLYGTKEFAKIQNDAFDIWKKCPKFDPSESNLINELRQKFKIPLLGYHYFINDNGTLRPKFDLTSTGPNKGNPDAFVVASKALGVPAPNSSQDVDWLLLKALSGKLADEVFRVYTKGGQPPTSCTPGSGPISVKYTTQYWFEGGSL